MVKKFTFKEVGGQIVKSFSFSIVVHLGGKLKWWIKYLTPVISVCYTAHVASDTAHCWWNTCKSTTDPLPKTLEVQVNNSLDTFEPCNNQIMAKSDSIHHVKRNSNKNIYFNFLFIFFFRNKNIKINSDLLIIQNLFSRVIVQCLGPTEQDNCNNTGGNCDFYYISQCLK